MVEQELNRKVTSAIVARQSKILFILFKSWVNKLIKEIQQDLAGRVYLIVVGTKVMPGYCFS
jgi:hypothetical protein